MTHMKPIDPKELNESAFRLIGSDWMLVTAGTPDKWNTMTASWGGLGVLWNKNVVYVFIRPGRHTFSFLEANDFFTLSFFDESWRKALLFCGTESGRDVDKAKETGLQPIAAPHDTVTFSQSRLVLTCRKMYHQEIDPDQFLDPDIMKHYPLHDYHRQYIAEIVACHLAE